MASVTVKSDFGDGETLLIQVVGKTTYPDALDQMKSAALEAYREALAIRLAAPVEEAE